jgi:sporulation protein YlmC with PRC-barrel domain
MRLSDLLGSDVVDQAQCLLGRVHDVRAIQDGPVLGPLGAAFRIEGLIVGRGSIATRLGLDRTDVKGPAAFRFILQRLRPEPVFVPWDRIVALEGHRIIVSGSAAQFQAPLRLSSTEQVDPQN